MDGNGSWEGREEKKVWMNIELEWTKGGWIDFVKVLYFEMCLDHLFEVHYINWNVN
jgi:hypothetical protein